jgi:HEAT repeat protein
MTVHKGQEKKVDSKALFPNWRALSIAMLIATMVILARPASARGQVPVKPEPAPARLLADLKSPRADARRAAANQLGALRARDAARPLIAALLDRDASVREAAAFALGQMTDVRAVSPLINALADKDPEVQASAAFALGMIGDRKATQALSNALGESSPQVRAAAVAALGLMQDYDGLDEVISMLDDPSIDVRYDAVWALGQIGAIDAVEHLHAALVNLDLVRIDDSQLEGYREAVQNSIERLKALDEAQTKSGRPRRAIGSGGQLRGEQSAQESARPLIVRRSVRPAPTERALKARVSGSVGLKVLVGVEGRAVRAYVTRRLGFGLDQRAIEAVLQYQIDPEIKSGLPQTSWINMEIKY